MQAPHQRRQQTAAVCFPATGEGGEHTQLLMNHTVCHTHCPTDHSWTDTHPTPGGATRPSSHHTPLSCYDAACAPVAPAASLSLPVSTFCLAHRHFSLSLSLVWCKQINPRHSRIPDMFLVLRSFRLMLSRHTPYCHPQARRTARSGDSMPHCACLTPAVQLYVYYTCSVL